MQHQSRQSRPSSSADRSSLPRPSGERTSRRSEDYSTPRSATRPSAERSSAKDRSPRPPATNRSSVDRHHVDRSRAPYQSSEEREARPRRRTSTERHDTKQRSASLPAEAHMLQEDFPEGGRESRIQKRRQSAPAGDMIPLIQSALRVTTQYLSINTKGLTQDLTQHKRVEFAFLEVREYPVVLGDNPSVLEGPPITIDWAHDPSTEFVLDINTFERMRGNRRTSAELVLPRHVRERWYVVVIGLKIPFITPCHTKN